MNNKDLQRVFRHVPAPLLVLRADPGFTIVAASDAYMRVAHCDAAIYGRSVFDAFPDSPDIPAPGGVATLRASLQRVVATRASHTMPTLRYDVQRPAGQGGGFEERFWTSVNAPVLDGEGEVEYVVHRVEEEAAKTKRDAIAILESIGEGFFTLDRQWRFDYVNTRAHTILGREPGSLAGKVLWAEYPGLEGTEFERAYRRAMHQREAGSFTAFYAGMRRWFEVSTFPAPEGVSVYFRDVTAARLLEVEAERQRRIYETALDSTPDFVYVFDLEHRALYANQALLTVWGVDDVRGKRWTELGYARWHADLHDAEINRVIATRAPIRGEVPFTGTNGRRVYDYIFAPVLGPDGEVVAVAGTTRDITERQASEQSAREQAERLAALDRAKDDFLATLSHELRNPLAPLRNALEAMRRTDASPSTDRLRGVMERQVRHLVRLVDDLLEVSRISRGELALRRERVELVAIVDNALETSGPLIDAARHTLARELPAEPLWIDGDPVRLAQVLANLLNNAARYTPDGGHISVTARRDGAWAVLCVRDNGAGIEPDSIERMFEMFSRGERDSSRHQGGLGIGLALSRRLAEMHGGTLTAHSGGPGQGSAFTVRLPLAPPDALLKS